MFPQFLGKQHLLDEIYLQIIRYVINMLLQQFFVYFCCRKVCCSSTIRETMQPTGRQVCNHSPLWVVVWITVLAKGNMLVCNLSDHLETIIQIVIANRRTRQKKMDVARFLQRRGIPFSPSSLTQKRFEVQTLLERRPSHFS